MLPLLEQFQAELRDKAKEQRDTGKAELRALVDKQRAERKAFLETLAKRQQQEALTRQARFRSGLWGFWDKLRGTHKRIQAENEREAEIAKKRDQEQKDRLIAQQLSYRRATLEEVKARHREHLREQLELKRDHEHYLKLQQQDLCALRDQVIQTGQPTRRRRNTPSRGHEPSM
jgi:hypothetical protein